MRLSAKTRGKPLEGRRIQPGFPFRFNLLAFAVVASFLLLQPISTARSSDNETTGALQIDSQRLQFDQTRLPAVTLPFTQGEETVEIDKKEEIVETEESGQSGSAAASSEPVDAEFTEIRLDAAFAETLEEEVAVRSAEKTIGGDNNDVTASVPVTKSQHHNTDTDAEILFSISIDGEHVAGTPPPEKNAGPENRQTAEATDVKVKFDGLEVSPVLNVSTIPLRRAYRAGENIIFLATANYPVFIERAEIRITAEDRRSALLIPVSPNGTVTWPMPRDGPADYSYTLRVYDAKGRFDETAPLTVSRTVRFTDGHEKLGAAIAPGLGEDRTETRNIPVRGGTVTVFGSQVPSGHDVTVMGDRVPVDRNGAFFVQRVLPAGDHEIDVTIDGGSGGNVSFQRFVNIPTNDWFYVALADLTIGHRTGSSGIEAVRPGEFDGMYTKGRLAFYLKGKIKGSTLLTAAADTGEGELRSLFRGLDEKNARDLLRRLDPDDFYPVYGDDSTTVEDAPTRGKFYVRIDRGDSHVMWGSYKTTISGTELMRSDRGLYGASGVYRSETTTSFGERQTEITTYAAQPGTLPQRDVFKGTGGSAYFLKYQDISAGSETVLVEIRDSTSGAIVDRQRLQAGKDYQIDYIQGVIILDKPLASMTGTSQPVRQTAIGGQEVYLIVQYEFTPAAGDVDGYVYGGRVQQWLGEYVRIGVTGMSEKTGLADQIAYGADIRIRKSEETYLEAEIAQSEGPGFSTSTSADGGSTVTDVLTPGAPGRAAKSWRLKARASLGEITGDRFEGSIGGYFEKKQAGFATLAEQISIDQRIWGAHLELPLSGNTMLKLEHDEFEDASGKQKRLSGVSVIHDFDSRWQLAVGIEHIRLMTPLATTPGLNGSRTDLGARIAYQANDDHLYYVFGQTTASRSGDIRRNDRLGVGAEIKLTEKVSLIAEASHGATGFGGLASVIYQPTADDQYYVGYKLDPDRIFDAPGIVALSGTDKGTIVAGTKRKLNDTLSVYAENNYDIFGRRRSATRAYGVIYTPDAVWTVNGGLEWATIRDESIDPATGFERSDFDRKAFSSSVGYNDEEAGIEARMRGEARFEESTDGTRNRNTWLVAAGLKWQRSENWRFIAHFDAVISDAEGSTFRDGSYLEGSIGYAYRPINGGPLNALFKYTYLYDLPGPDQVNVSGDLLGPAQRSHILSVDASYDVNRWLTIGGKYGVRVGERRARGAARWEQSIAHLGIVRADVHVVKNWDALLEARVLYIPGQDTTDFGLLIAIYRHFGNNFKVGLGYNFGRFSDDLRDQTYDDRGVFLNVIGKF